MVRNKRVAANRVLIDSETVENNLMIERNTAGQITRICSINSMQCEPSSTIFYNGLITTDFAHQGLPSGAQLPALIEEALVVGYEGKLLLWQHIALDTLSTLPETTVKEI